MNELHLFAGAGGGILAGQQLGHRCVAAVEWEPYAQAVLVARQNDGTFPPFPIWDDDITPEQALEEAAKVCDRQAIPNAGFLAEKVRALININLTTGEMK